MKGLLIKDYKLVILQKNSFFFIMIVGIGLIFSNVFFAIEFATFIFSLFSLTSISYDEFDNGNAFLFSLPISRNKYVIEKYCFGLIMGTVSWISFTIFALVIKYFELADMSENFMEILSGSIMIVPFMLIALSIMIPFQLKFGADKGRIAIMCCFGILFGLSAVIVKIIEFLNIDLSLVFNNFASLNMEMLIIFLLFVSIILLLLSIKISIAIVKNKEF